jgi:hypothetical protein
MINYVKLDYFKFSCNGDEGFTVGILPNDFIDVDANGVNLVGPPSVPNIVHQYNKHKKLIQCI